ncbi:transcription and mRNA export factor ENY2-like [Panonychus citri]|uniref:transcription and mRNA export factor ENY2-like n=1 Tax=Panonychus citri TaxID=50023 RepID=UPI00230781A8|nr:transcription and mRNA export factor ENY2-like [Panonychus citri]
MDSITEEVRAKANQLLERKGARDELRKLLHNRLIETQFSEKIVEMCKQFIKGKDVETITIDDLVNAVVPEARKLVPDSVREELLDATKKVITDDEAITEQLNGTSD